MNWKTLIAIAISLFLGFVLRGLVAREPDRADREILDRLNSLERIISGRAQEKSSPFVFCANVQPTPSRIPNVLQAARVLPFPPVNLGRVILYESFSREKIGGTDYIIFREFRDGNLTNTSIPASEVRWGGGPD